MVAAYLANVRVDRLEPVPELFILLSIAVQRLYRIADGVKALPVGKTFEQRAQLRGGLLQGRITLELLARVFACDSMSDCNLPESEGMKYRGQLRSFRERHILPSNRVATESTPGNPCAVDIRQ